MEEDTKKESLNSTEPDGVVRPGRKERILAMFVRIFRLILRFLEKKMIVARQKRLAKRMEGKK